ncbi:MAG: phosphatidylglycerophosphatase A [Erysipelothrix sp.]|nr:phosphatidylglycerophosphatase A [Erysipelothrix sp.]
MSMKMVELLQSRGVAIDDIIDCVAYLEEGFSGNPLDRKQTEENILEILAKREVEHAIRTGIALDVMAEKGLFEDKLIEDVIVRDESLYGVDEVLAYGICNLYGSIALTNFGYVDRVKPGIIGRLNDAKDGECHTYLDDIVGAITASAASKSAHNR